MNLGACPFGPLRNLDALARAGEKDLLRAIGAFNTIVLALESDHSGATLDGHEVVFALQAQFLEIPPHTQTALVAARFQATTGLDFQILHLPRAFKDLGSGRAAESGQQAPQE